MSTKVKIKIAGKQLSPNQSCDCCRHFVPGQSGVSLRCGLFGGKTGSSLSQQVASKVKCPCWRSKFYYREGVVKPDPRAN
ncbi:hypothetical protein LCGC14_2048170 [marine sediment metagenome]|uniref:Uncharacterized protein n=1 Tax=marine sediment metagenome TaxID=412755 RepID=A0A0F9EPR4_9ZZZZ